MKNLSKKMKTMKIKKNNKIVLSIVAGVFLITSCVPNGIVRDPQIKAPQAYDTNSTDTINSGQLKWNEYFKDQNLVALIDSALANNQELNIILQEIQIAQNEISAKKGEYLPFLNLGAEAGADKVARYTPMGALEKNNSVTNNKAFPEPLGNLMIGAYATWEVDVWKKLRNARKSAIKRYSASVEGRNFMVTNLVSEIANSYYELLALDNQLSLIEQSVDIQSNALEVVRLQKIATVVTELPVKRFEAQLFHTKSLQYEVKQRIIETENRINFLVGRYPQPVKRDASVFPDFQSPTIQQGLPSQLLANRPDIRQSEMQLEAAKLDVKVARARFYPSFSLNAGVGLQAFNASYLLSTPESILYNLAGDMVAPLINRKALKATYYNSNAKQLQAVFEYEKTILNAYIEVVNQVNNISNLEKSYELRAQEVDALTQSITISNNLYKSARADYMEVLFTQRDALQARFELIETKMRQLHAIVNIYRALGGGWK
jgi:multidrug efflux system outer membrane protein